MSRNPFTYPAGITSESIDDLLAFHRRHFGGWDMTAGTPENDPPGDGDQNQPERPDDVSEEEWNALGDPGKRVIVREREARQAAERALAAARAKPAPPKPKEAPSAKPEEPKGKEGELDVEAIVQQAVDAAVKPFREAEERRQVEEAAGKVQNAVLDAAKNRLHDATDALAGIDLTTVVDEQGHADTGKIKTALDDLVRRKPHLAKVAERHAPPGIGGGAPAGATDAEKVKAVLADMQRATGVRLPAAPSTTN